MNRQNVGLDRVKPGVVSHISRYTRFTLRSTGNLLYHFEEVPVIERRQWNVRCGADPAQLLVTIQDDELTVLYFARGAGARTADRTYVAALRTIGLRSAAYMSRFEITRHLLAALVTVDEWRLDELRATSDGELQLRLGGK